MPFQWNSSEVKSAFKSMEIETNKLQELCLHNAFLSSAVSSEWHGWRRIDT